MKKYKKLGEFGFMDQQGRLKEYIDQDSYVQKLERENELLKKCLEIWRQEIKQKACKEGLTVITAFLKDTWLKSTEMRFPGIGAQPEMGYGYH